MLAYIEAEYEDGYVHREDEQDHSPFVSGKNIFDDILHNRPCSAHGQLIRFSLVTQEQRYDVDWKVLPENARPIRFKHMQATIVGGIMGEPSLASVDFGYQYTNNDGENVQEIVEVTF